MKLFSWRDRLDATKRTDYAASKLRWFCERWGDCEIDTITPDRVDDYIEWRRADGVRDVTISKELASLKQLLRLAKRSGQYSGDTDILKPTWLRSSSKPRTRALTGDEVKALLAATSGALRAFVALVVATGARRSEALRIQPGDVTCDAVRIPGSKTERAAGTVPVLGPYRPLLAIFRPLLPLQAPANVNRDLLAACDRAGIERCTPNDLRRTHITLLREAGIDRDTAKQLLRHSPSSHMLDRVYDQSRPEEVARRVAPVLAECRVFEGLRGVA